MERDEVTRATAEVFGSIDGWDDSYLTTELLDEYEAQAEEYESQPDYAAAGEAELVADVASLYYYGNRPSYVRDTSRPGYVGRLYFYNGSTNRPNDPCGTRFRRLVWCRYSPRGYQYRNCGRYWGFQFIV